MWEMLIRVVAEVEEIVGCKLPAGAAYTLQLVLEDLLGKLACRLQRRIKKSPAWAKPTCKLSTHSWPSLPQAKPCKGPVASNMLKPAGQFSRSAFGTHPAVHVAGHS